MGKKSKLLKNAVNDFIDECIVDLSSSNLTEDDVRTLVDEILENPVYTGKINKGIKFIKSYLNLNDNNEIGDQSVKHLSKLKPLKNLYLSNCGVTDKGVEYIANNLAKLEVLNLSKNNISKNGIGAIANKLHKLKSLDISENTFGWPGVKALSEFKELNLKTLNISNDKLLKEDLPGLIDISYGDVFLELIKCLPKSLDSLSIAGYQQLDDRIAGAITNMHNKQAKSTTQHLQGLSSLNLSGCSISDQGVKILIANLWILSSLNLSNCKNITDLSLAHIAEGANNKYGDTSNPTQLNLSNCNQITSKGIEYLNKCKVPLTHLNLSGFKQIHIRDLLRLTSLQSLDLSDSDILSNTPNVLIHDLTYLKFLNISNCKNITPEELKKLQMSAKKRGIKIKCSELPYQNYPTSRFNINYCSSSDSE
ncbi:hypothetical protein [Allofrancisella frigidaquae]|uniref:Leucine-rich repeat domain-containing protein n=1 Tax=Allofrancisella frigidaquae TaxID=1085644 RepID=A0A6M3HUR9_9GAMM|nr:hypothetical protein [Allofrancisella frigidaquae]QIV93992.1 hypothetical protein E3E15_00900 [Allofrancisella frigidaquae]